MKVGVDGESCVSYLYGNDANRNLNCNDARNEWYGSSWFLGLSEFLHSPPKLVGGVSFLGMLCIHFPSMFPMETSFCESGEY